MLPEIDWMRPKACIMSSKKLLVALPIVCPCQYEKPLHKLHLRLARLSKPMNRRVYRISTPPLIRASAVPSWYLFQLSAVPTLN